MNDQGKRGQVAVAFSLTQSSRDRLHIFMDKLDQVEADGLRHRVWHHDTFVTTIDTDRATLDEMTFTEEQLRGVGLMVVSALRAYYRESLGLKLRRGSGADADD